MDNTVKQRLVQFIKCMHMTQRAFEIRCGMSNGYVANIRKGIGNDYLLNIAQQFPELNREWLLYGEGEMLKKSTTIAGDITITGNHNSHIGHGQHNMPTVIEVKDNSIEVECPNCGEVIEVTNTAVIPLVPPEVAKRPDINLENFRHCCPQQMEEVDLRQVWGKGVFLMKVDTRAMEPEYREGTFLVLRRLKDLTYARPDGSAYVIDTMRPHTLFRYLSKERDGTYVLSAESDKRGPIYLNAEDIINIYDVVGSFRIGR